MNGDNLDMFDTPIARSTDPETSKTAAAAQTESGKRASDAAILLELVKRYPGHTAAEYSYLLKGRGVDWYHAARMPTKRLSDLLNRGSVRAGKPRLCRVTDRSARTYYGVD